MIAEVYRNLHRDTYSIRNKATGLVSFYSNHVVLQSGHKNVHAFVRGALVARGVRARDKLSEVKLDFCLSHKLQEITYNPRKYASFVVKDTLYPIYGTEFVLLSPKAVYALGETQ